MKVHGTGTQEIKRSWYVVDAEGQVLGRLASRIAHILRGKHKPTFSPNLDGGDHVVVVNAAQIVLKGNKISQKVYYRHSGYPGGLKETPYEKLIAETPEKAVMLAVKRMLPRNRLGRKMLKKLRVYGGHEHPHQGQDPQPIQLNT